MPIYEFCCRSCETVFEELVSSSGNGGAGIECPECGSKKVDRLFSSFSFKSAGGQGPASTGSSASGCGSCTKSSCTSCG